MLCLKIQTEQANYLTLAQQVSKSGGRKHDTVVKELLKRGANPNGQKVHPLRHLIYTEGNEELIKIFIDIADLSKGARFIYLVVSSGNESAI